MFGESPLRKAYKNFLIKALTEQFHQKNALRNVPETHQERTARMTPHCVSQGYIRSEHIVLRNRVAAFMDMLPDGLNCHEVCERVVQNFGNTLIHVKGMFNDYDHSWLEIRGTRLILDAYPWACASGPFLVDCQTGSPWSSLYRCGKCGGLGYVRVKDPTAHGDTDTVCCPMCNPDPTGSGMGSKP